MCKFVNVQRLSRAIPQQSQRQEWEAWRTKVAECKGYVSLEPVLLHFIISLLQKMHSISVRAEGGESSKSRMAAQGFVSLAFDLGCSVSRSWPVRTGNNPSSAFGSDKVLNQVPFWFERSTTNKRCRVGENPEAINKKMKWLRNRTSEKRLKELGFLV